MPDTDRRTVPALLSHARTTRPDHTVITLLDGDDETPITYAGLFAAAAGVAHQLAALGVDRDRPIINILQHGAPLVYAFYGGMLYGGIPAILPFLTEKLSPEVYRRSLTSLLGITRPAAIVTYAEFAGEVRQAIADAPECDCKLLVLAPIVPEADPPPDLLHGLDRTPDQIALLQHSSGTTGLQKGVALSHRAIFNQLDACSQALRLSDDDVIVSWLPLYHDMGLIAGFLMPVLAGLHLVLMSPFEWVRAPHKLLQAASRHRGTLTWLPNFAYNFMARKIRDRDLDGVDLASLRAVINCSEPMYDASHTLFRQHFAPWGLRPGALATSYAMAENVFAVTQGGIDRPVTIDPIDPAALRNDHIARPVPDGDGALRMVSAGPPLPNCQVRVVDEARNPLPDRQIGELALRSNCMLTGYYHRDDLTAQAFHDGWYLTGDLGYLADGEVYITGRKKDLIIVGGKNVYPQDIEATASEVEGVIPGRVVAFGVTNPQAGTEDVVLIAETALDGDAKRELGKTVRLRVNQSTDVALRDVLLVERGWLLKTSSGKIARGANRERYLAAKAG